MKVVMVVKSDKLEKLLFDEVPRESKFMLLDLTDGSVTGRGDLIVEDQSLVKEVMATALSCTTLRDKVEKKI